MCAGRENKTRKNKQYWQWPLRKVDFVSVTLVYFKPPRSKFTVAVRTKFRDLSSQQEAWISDLIYQKFIALTSHENSGNIKCWVFSKIKLWHFFWFQGLWQVSCDVLDLSAWLPSRETISDHHKWCVLSLDLEKCGPKPFRIFFFSMLMGVTWRKNRILCLFMELVLNIKNSEGCLV